MNHFKFRSNAYRTSKGFTLVELLVVIAIIGILAAAAYPVILGQVARAKENVAVGQAHSLCLAFFSYGSDVVNGGSLPAYTTTEAAYQALYTGGYLKDPNSITISGVPAAYYTPPTVAAGVITVTAANGSCWGYTSNGASGLSLSTDPSTLPLLASIGGWAARTFATDSVNTLTYVPAQNPFGSDGLAVGYLNMSSAFCKRSAGGPSTVDLTPTKNLSYATGPTYNLNPP